MQVLWRGQYVDDRLILQHRTGRRRLSGYASNSVSIKPLSVIRFISTSEANCRSYFVNLPASNMCEGKTQRDSANAPLTTLARSTLCIVVARETTGLSKSKPLSLAGGRDFKRVVDLARNPRPPRPSPRSSARSWQHSARGEAGHDPGSGPIH